jgi:phage baseplate assembly protein W
MYLSTYTLKAWDTLQNVLQLFPATKDEQTLINLNNLEYPYIVDADYPREGYSQGTVTVTKSEELLNTEVTIPKGTRLLCLRNGIWLSFLTTEELTLVSGIQQGDINVTAESYGEAYNVPENSTWKFDSEEYSGLTISNDSEFSGGYYKRVLKPGESIYVVIDDGQSNTLLDYNDLYGTDIFAEYNPANYETFGEVEAGPQGDLYLVSGAENVAQALVRKLITVRGSYFLHPEYGSLLPTYIGHPTKSHLPERLAFEVRQTLMQDFRVKDVTNIDVKIFGDRIDISCKVLLKTDLVLPLSTVVRI